MMMLCPARNSDKPVQFAATQFPGAGWNRMPVGILERLAQMSGDGLLQARGDGVFERFGLGIDLAPIETKHLSEKEFDQAVAANDAKGFT